MAGRLHIRVDEGRGPAMVLLHGFPLDGSIWADVAGLLAGRYRVIVPDLRGFGGSAYSPFTIKDLAADVAEQVLAMGVQRAVFAGLSMGGYVMLELWKQSPELVAGLAMVNTKAEADTTEAKAGRDAMAQLALSEGATAVAQKMMGRLLHPSRYGSDVEDRVMKMMSACPAQTIANSCLAMRDRADFTAELGRIRVPSRMITGEADQVVPLALARATAQGLARGRLVVVPQAGHLASIEAAGAVADALDSLGRETFG
jgi:pimeloyl-ACP methyl ester carboxylesterase